MTDVILDVEDGAFVLSGSIEKIRQSRRAKSNFIAIGAAFTDAGVIRLPYEEGKEAETYSNLERLLDKFGCRYKQTATAEEQLKAINQEKENFVTRSEKARKIRNNEHEDNDFKQFVGVVEEQIKRELYPLQLLSAYHLAFAQNACNFSVPGAGKTTVVYAAYAYLKHSSNPNKYVNRMLIICPLSAFAPWKSEYKKCFGTPPQVRELVGLSPRERANHFISPRQTELTLISYQSAAADIKHIKNYLDKEGEVMVVLDEAHKIKNTDDDAVWANAIKSLAPFAKARVVLTGTPAPNSYEDLWNLYQFIWPSKDIIGFPLHSLGELRNKPKERNRFVKNIEPFFIRVRTADLNLPEPRFNEPILVRMNESQKEIYDFIEGRYIPSFTSQKESAGPAAKLRRAKIVRLRQCATNPELLKKPLQEFNQNGISEVYDRDILQIINAYRATPPKFIEVAKLAKKITTASGPAGKAIIWVNFIDTLHSLRDYLASQEIKSEVMYGATPNENEDTPDDVRTRERIIRDFHNADCPYRVIIANPFAVGESISLHEACHNAIYLEKDFSAMNHMQSKNRTYRFGLKDDDVVNYYFLLSADTIDETIHRRIVEKEKVMLDIIEREEIPLLQGAMDDVDDDDIAAIIEDYRARKATATSD